MRKFIFAGIITILAVITWIGYLKYDTKKFIKELSLEPLPKQQVNSTAKNASETSMDSVTKTKQTGLENTPEQTLEEVAPLLADTNTGTEMERSGIESGQTQESTALSPELEKLFTSYYNIRKEIEKVDKMELVPLQTQSLLMYYRRTEIYELLDTDLGESTSKSLYAELEEMDEWGKEFNPRIYELQDEVHLIFEKQAELLKAHDFPSWENFWGTHQETYKTWVSDQFK